MTRVHALLALASLAACADTSLSYIRTGRAPAFAPASPSRVELFSDATPLPPSAVEVGLMEWRQERYGGPISVERLSVEAARHGCDAIVLHDPCFATVVDVRPMPNGRNSFAFQRREARVVATCVVLDPRTPRPR